MIRQAELSLTSGMQLFLGANAQGKTSIIEAILFLSTSTSHRTSREEELIQWEQETAFLRGDVERERAPERLECGIERKRKVIRADGVVLPRVRELYGRLRTVLFAPEDLSIVAGGPAERRRFLDMAISQNNPAYIETLQHYRRVLKQRNHVLKQWQGRMTEQADRELEVWNGPFVDLAEQVMRERAEATRMLAEKAKGYYDGLADDGPFEVRYPAAETGESTIRERLLERLERSRSSERERGSTQTGPHRDDLVCSLDGRTLVSFGSQGQRRAAALALRLAQAKVSFEFTGVWPILLIDDVVYEMDNMRRARFWESVDSTGQLIVTATDRDHLGTDRKPAQCFGVDHGQVCTRTP